VGITGEFGTGKSTIAKMLSRRWRSIEVDADKIAHACLKKSTDTYRKIVKHFGAAILNDSGDIDRKKLAKASFGNTQSIRRLSEIIHPVVIKEIEEIIKRAAKDRKTNVVIIDAPLLIESSLHRICDRIIVVKSSRAAQIARIRQKTGLTISDIMLRIKSQMPYRKKRAYADYVIDNNGTMEDTKDIAKKVVDHFNEYIRKK
jgi:dephospho-CoA kinase